MAIMNKKIMVIIMISSMFFMLGFVGIKLLLKEKKTEIPINQIQTQPPPLPPIVQQQVNEPTATPSSQPSQQNTQQSQPVVEQKQEEEKKKIVDTETISKKNINRDIFKDFYTAKKNKDNKDISQNQNQQFAPPVALPPLPSVQQQTKKQTDVKVYGFYVSNDIVYAVTNIGILTANSKISNEEHVISVTKEKIITNLREIYF